MPGFIERMRASPAGSAAHETSHNRIAGGALELWHALTALLPRFLMYAMSVLALGIFWIGQQTQLNHLERSDRDLAWLHIVLLASIALMPFATTLLASFIEYRTALLVY